MARIGLSLDDDTVKLAAPPDPPRPDATARLAAFDRREGFIVQGDKMPSLSPVLAAKLHYRSSLHKSDHPEDRENEAAGDDGYEGLRHG